MQEKEKLYRKRRRSLFEHFALYLGLYRYVEIGCGEYDRFFPAFDHHVLQDWKRSLSCNYVLNALEAFYELGPENLEFHFFLSAFEDLSPSRGRFYHNIVFKNRVKYTY